MTAHQHRVDKVLNKPDDQHALMDPFYTNANFIFSIANLLFESQHGTSEYIRAYRLFADTMRDAIRKEQDHALETYQRALKTLTEERLTVPDGSDMSAIFERAGTRMREFSDAWLSIQHRSLDVLSSGALEVTSRGANRHWAQYGRHSSDKDTDTPNAAHRGEGKTSHVR